MNGLARFRPAPLPTLAAALLFPVLVWLGLWQLDRAGEKRALSSAFERGAGTPLALEEAAAADLYRRVRAGGRYDSERQFLIDNMVHQGRNGFYVLTPLAPAGGGPALLVNRGWVPQDPARRRLPEVAVAETPRELDGRVGKLPAAGLRLGEAQREAASWPNVRQFPEISELEQALGTKLRPWVLLLDPAAPDGYLREWRPPALGPERHLGYALQWFALAATLLVIWIVLTWKRSARERRHPID